MDRLTPSFGIALPAFASPGAGLFRTPGVTSPDARYCLELAQRADAAGFASIWAPDHLMIGRDDAVFEGWTLLSAVAGTTRNARLGLIQQSNLFRHPAVLAKAAATLDAISDGRFTLFFNYGTKQAETEAFGLDFPGGEDVRIAMAGEALEIVTTLWHSQDPLDHAGRFYKLKRARALPLPRSLPPIWFAGTHPRNLDLLARFGSGWCTPPASLAELSERLALVDAALKAHGRAQAELEITLETQILVAESEDALRAKLADLVALDPLGSLSGRPPVCGNDLDDFLAGRSPTLPAPLADKWIVGTPEAVIARISDYNRAGIDHFIFWFMDLPGEDSLSLFTENIMPHFMTARKNQRGAGS